jgi:hypothetical protein
MINDIEELEKVKLTVNIVWANIFGLILLSPTIAIFGIPYYVIWENEIFPALMKSYLITNPPMLMLSIVVAVFLGVVTHELLHGITWARFTKKGFKSIEFGFIFKMLTPYCHCKEPLLIKHYILGAIMPAIVLGIIPSIVSILIGSLGMLLFGIFFTIAACGDFLCINMLLKENMNDWVEDHPTEAGCFVYRNRKQD